MEPLEIGAETTPDSGLHSMPARSDAAQRRNHSERQDIDDVSEKNSSSWNSDQAVQPTPANASMVSSINAETPITYRYLTFTTPLPVVNRGNGQSSGFRLSRNDALPDCPDLARYANPLFWPKSRKTIMVAVSCIATLSTAYTAGAYAPMADHWAAEYSTTRVVALTGITLFCLGFALAPMVLAPYSEVTGRYPVFVVAGIFFIVFQAVCGLAPNLEAQLIAQFIKGCGASVFSTMVGGVIADLYEKEQRNTPMAFFSGSVLAGTGLGPLVSSVMVEYMGADWKWAVWHQVIFDFLVIVTVVTLFRESRGIVLLSKKARVLNVFYEALESHGVFGVWIGPEDTKPEPLELGNCIAVSSENRDPTCVEKGNSSMGNTQAATLQRIRWLVKEDEQRASMMEMVKTSLTRPFYLLFTEPIVFFFSLWVAFAWGVLYLTFASIPIVYRRVYHFNTAQCGYVFVGMVTGAAVATWGGWYQDRLLRHPAWQNGGASSERDGTSKGDSKFWALMRRRFPVESPESRLYFTCVASICLPLGLFLFGFSAQPDIHWIVPAIAIFLATIGIYFVYLATFNYFADTYQLYASSALASQSCCRNIMGGAFPLVTGLLFTNLGEDAAGGLLGGIATILTIVPWVLVFFGETIRSRSKFAVVSGPWVVSLIMILDLLADNKKALNRT